MIFEIENYASMREALERFCRFLTDNGVATERVFDSRLVASELVGNVLKHAKEKARFCAEIKDGFLELCVFSKTPFEPPKISKNAEVYAEHGRGFFLVDSVSEERTLTKEGGIFVRIKIQSD